MTTLISLAKLAQQIEDSISFDEDGEPIITIPTTEFIVLVHDLTTSILEG